MMVVGGIVSRVGMMVVVGVVVERKPKEMVERKILSVVVPQTLFF
jgi:hypothetical protein